MSRASDHAAAVSTHKAESELTKSREPCPPSHKARSINDYDATVSARATDDGGCVIIIHSTRNSRCGGNHNSARHVISPEEAVIFGRALIEIFGETDEPKEEASDE